MNVDSKNEQLANLHVDLTARKVDLARQCNLSWDLLGSVDGAVYQIFVQ